MSENLPLHIATADEPIPAPSRHPLRNEPDMREVTPLGVMLADLAQVDDEVAYVGKLMEFVSETGCSLLAHYNRDGDLGLTAGYPTDAQCRHRNRWMHYLIAAVREHEGREDLLLRTLIDKRMCWDERPANPRETTRAIRDWLRVGGRLLINPQGRVQEGAEVPAALLHGSTEEIEEFRRAGRVYFAARRRWRADRQIARVVRKLGTPTENGWIVLEGLRA